MKCQVLFFYEYKIENKTYFSDEYEYNSTDKVIDHFDLMAEILLTGPLKLKTTIVGTPQ